MYWGLFGFEKGHGSTRTSVGFKRSLSDHPYLLTTIERLLVADDGFHGVEVETQGDVRFCKFNADGKDAGVIGTNYAETNIT